MQETTSRDKFSWNTLEYYSIFLNTLKSSKLLLAYCEEKVIAWWIFIFDNNVSIYYYGASTSDKKYRNLMAPYLLQWEAIKIARNNWSKIYDFLWIAKQWEKNSSLIWVTNFKLKLTKDTREVSTSYIYINKKIKYFLIDVLRKIKNN
jgi:lipid II:glycine glycyltransferase (peptidoglycan interpeptide bridge formation enzyme)